MQKNEATGLAIHSLFFAGSSPGSVHAVSAIQAPLTPTVDFRSMATGVIAIGGGIRHVMNDPRAAVDATTPDGAVFGMTAVTRLPANP